MTKLECAKRFSSQATRPGLRLLSLALLAASAYASSVTGTTFTATGTFDGGDTLSGTITISTVGSGGILSEDLMINSGGTTLYTFNGTLDIFESLGSQEIGSTNTYYYNVVFDGTPNTNDPVLNLDIYLGGSDNFNGYAGGPLCSDNYSCGGAETSFSVDGDPNLGSGNLSSSPEPSTALLAFAGAGALAMLRRMKRPRSSPGKLPGFGGRLGGRRIH